MPSRTKPTSARYIATIKNVREVILIGAADLSLWQKLSAPPDLYPQVSNDRLTIAISATDARWLGRRIQELTISIPVSPQEDGSTYDGSYLALAYNSSVFFAAIERRSFHTPYQKGSIEVITNATPSIKLTRDNVDLIDVQMRSERPAISEGEETWEGAIYLPPDESNKSRKNRLFYAFLGGVTRTFSFDDETDRLHFDSEAEDDLYRLLLESNFNAIEWRIREKAIHARSRSFNR